MRKYGFSALPLLVTFSFVLIEGSFLSLVCALCALWHELGHILALRFVGGKVKSAFAGVKGISLKTDGLGYANELAVCLAGPVLSGGSALVFWLLALLFNNLPFFVFAAACNLVLFLLNILPLYPLDGGRALFCFICLKTDPVRAGRIMRILSFIFLLPLSVLSVIIMINSGYNLTLLIICLYLLALLTGAYQL